MRRGRRAWRWQAASLSPPALPRRARVPTRRVVPVNVSLLSAYLYVRCVICLLFTASRRRF